MPALETSVSLFLKLFIEVLSLKKDTSLQNSSGLGNIGSRPLGRGGLEGAPPRVTIKEGHILEGHLTAGEYFGRFSDCGCIFWKVI